MEYYKNQKAKFTKHLHELCLLNDKGEYTSHHEFSQSLIEADEECVLQIGNYIAERNNPFDTSSVTKLTNLVTGKEMEEKHLFCWLVSRQVKTTTTGSEKQYSSIKKKIYLIPSQRFVKCEKFCYN